MASIVGLAVEENEPSVVDRAQELADRLALPLTDLNDPQHPVLLVVTRHRLELRETGPRKVGAVYADFVGGAFGHRLRAGGINRQMIAKAVGFKGQPLTVIDATAGLGRDAMILACLGCRVTMIERSPVMAAVLADGLERAARVSHLRPAIERIRLQIGDARELLASLPEAGCPDVTYIDPMFPARAKSALNQKEMRICRQVTGDDLDAEELVTAAQRITRMRIVVKRPLRAAPLGGKPDFNYCGKAVRYDVFAGRLV